MSAAVIRLHSIKRDIELSVRASKPWSSGIPSLRLVRTLFDEDDEEKRLSMLAQAFRRARSRRASFWRAW